MVADEKAEKVRLRLVSARISLRCGAALVLSMNFGFSATLIAGLAAHGLGGLVIGRAARDLPAS